MLEEERDRQGERNKQRETDCNGFCLLYFNRTNYSHRDTRQSNHTLTQPQLLITRWLAVSLCESLVTMALPQNGFNILYTQHLLFSVFSTCFMSFLSFFNSIPHSKPRMSMPTTSVVNDRKTGWMNYKESNVGVKQIFHPTLSQSHKEHALLHHPKHCCTVANQQICVLGILGV